MAYKRFIKLLESEVDNTVSSRVGVQDVNINQLKLKVNDD